MSIPVKKAVRCDDQDDEQSWPLVLGKRGCSTHGKQVIGICLQINQLLLGGGDPMHFFVGLFVSKCVRVAQSSLLPGAVLAKIVSTIAYP